MSCPEEASASKPAQEGFWFLWAVLSVWPWRAFLSCFVLSCLFSPGGLLIPSNFPREFFFGGVEGFRLEWPGWGTRPRPQGPPAMASRAPSSAMASVVCSALEVPVLCSCPCLSWGASRAPTPPSPVELLRRGTRLPGRGSYVRVLLCVSSVPASCVHICCFLSLSLWVKYVPAVFVLLSVINLCILVHACSVRCRLVYLWLPGVSCLSALPCPALSTLKTIIWV